jgi:hypothetical protein
MPTPSIGIRIVYQGNNSFAGHMYVVLNDGAGGITSYGYYPRVSFPDGFIGGPGEVFIDKDLRDHEF